MTTYGIRFEAMAGYHVADDPRGRAPTRGQWLSHYDPEANDGQGFAEYTDDPDMALTFDNRRAAVALWRSVPRSRPWRPDGKPNRPLCAHTVAIERLPESRQRI